MLLALALGSLGIVHAATPGEIAHGVYLAGSGRAEEAVHVAVRALNENPDDMAAHHLYLQTLVGVLEDDPALLRQYRSRVHDQPQDAASRVALAMALSTVHDHAGLWCQELLGALDPLPSDTGIRTWALRTRYEARDRCATQADADREALLELSRITPTALAYGLRLRLEEGTVDEALASDLRALYEVEPWNMAWPGNLWARELKGPALKQARVEALAAAEDALHSGEPAVAVGAFLVFRNAENDPGRVKAELRRAELDPQWRTSDRAWSGERLSLTEEGSRSRLERDLERARRKATPEAARQALTAVDKRIPPSGTLRAIYLKELGMIQLREGRTDEAFATFRAAWQQDASHPSVANAFAYSAALKGQDLDLALVAIDTVIKKFPIYDPWRDLSRQGYDAWAEKTSNQIAARLDTQAWILHQLGRTEDAAALLQRALLLTRDADPILHHHLGFMLQALGKEDAALEQFGMGLSLGPSDEEDLDRKARAAAEKLFLGRRWSHRGFDGWLVARTTPDPAALACACVGQAFPPLPFKVGTVERRLSDYPGLRVVVLWNNQSLAFQRSLPYLENLARKYANRGVHVLALGVDAKAEDADWFWAGTPAPAFVPGWVGPAARDGLHFTRLPAIYVVDGEGLVRATFTGYAGKEERRVESRLDEILGPGKP